MSPAPAITDADMARALFARLADEAVEVAEAVYLDPKWRICGRLRFTGGSTDVTISIRRLVAQGLAADAARVLLAHNHPSGDPAPSTTDIAFTRRLATVLDAVGMPLADHLIVTRDAVTSLRQLGLL